MPGLVGLIGNLPKEEAIHSIRRMLDAVSYEAFYSRGFLVNDELGLYAGWVAHQGSLSDNMPARTPDEQIALLLSGEIFDLAAPKHDSGRHQSVGDSDANDLVCLYDEIGDNLFRRLNGTFSGVLVDSRSRSLKLFNDRLGYERIYYAHEPSRDVFYFSSEAKALLKVLPATREFDSRGLAQFLRYGCTFDETTLYRGISLLPPASVWEFSPGNSIPKKRCYFRPAEWVMDDGITPDELQESFAEIFCNVLPSYVKTHARLALSLTGGWDTRMILAGHRPRPKTLPCYTFAGLSGDTMDVWQARKVAGLAGQDYSVLRLATDFIENFANHAEKTVYVSDGYGSVCLSHEIYLNRLARHVSPLRLTGNFGGEVLRGVTTFKEVPLGREWFAGDLKEELRRSQEELKATARDGNAARFAVFKEIPWKIATTSRLANSQLTVRTPYLDNAILRLACMSPALSGRRLPRWFVGKVWPELASIPTDRGESGANHSLTETFRRGWHKTAFKVDYWLSEGLTGRLSTAIDSLELSQLLPRRHKYLDYRRWLNGPLKPYAEEMLRSSATVGCDLLGAEAVGRILREYELTDINALLTLELISKCLFRIDDPLPGSAAFDVNTRSREEYRTRSRYHPLARG